MEQSSGQSIQELFPAKDVVDFPISACPENAYTQQHQPAQEGCGIIIASKKTTIFAIDPTTGKVRWTQDPHGSAGGRGFTAHPPKSNNAARGRTVLLQREDYAVRHLDADIGRERWKLKLGQFSPLGFDVDDEANNSMNEDDDLLFSTKSSSSAAHGYLTFGQVSVLYTLLFNFCRELHSMYSIISSAFSPLSLGWFKPHGS
jgi:glucose dehydrogenase